MAKRILVVDNDPDCLEMVTEILAYSGYEVIAQNSGQVMPMLDKVKPDLLLIDYRLDGDSGGEICLRIKQDDGYRHLPVIIFSAYFGLADMLMKYQCNAFIPKPFDMDELVGQIDELLTGEESFHNTMNNNGTINKVILAGHILQQPRGHVNGFGRTLCFTVLTRETIKSSKGNLTHVEYHHVKINERCLSLNELNLKKDDFIYVQGKVITHTYFGEDQVRRYKTEIMATSLEVLISGVKEVLAIKLMTKNNKAMMFSKTAIIKFLLHHSTLDSGRRLEELQCSYDSRSQQWKLSRIGRLTARSLYAAFAILDTIERRT